MALAESGAFMKRNFEASKIAFDSAIKREI